jgi:hypothetical protein
MTDELPTEDVDRLFSLPLEEFIAERGALARRLRDAGDRDVAAAVGKLPKPSLAAWAINQLSREEPELTHELLRAGAALREAQARALAGENGEALRDAGIAERRAVEALVEAARDLRPAGRSPTSPTLDRIRATLQRAAADDETRALLRAGRLVKEAPPASGWPAGPEGLLDLESLIGTEPPPPERPRRKSRPAERSGDDESGAAVAEPTEAPAPRKQTPKERLAEEKEREEARRRAEQQQRRTLERQLRAARTERQMKIRAVERAERSAGEANQRLQKALAAVERGREDSDAWKRRLKDARADAARAEEEVARLEEELGGLPN